MIVVNPNLANSLPIQQGKAKLNHQNQKGAFFKYLKTHVATNSMVSDATGVPQKNLTRFKREFEKEGLLFEVFKGLCKKTNHRATFLTTNKALFESYKV